VVGAGQQPPCHVTVLIWSIPFVSLLHWLVGNAQNSRVGLYDRLCRLGKVSLRLAWCFMLQGCLCERSGIGTEPAGCRLVDVIARRSCRDLL